MRDIEHLDQNDGSLGRFGVMLLPRVSKSEIASNADSEVLQAFIIRVKTSISRAT